MLTLIRSFGFLLVLIGFGLILKFGSPPSDPDDPAATPPPGHRDPRRRFIMAGAGILIGLGLVIQLIAAISTPA